MSETSDKIKAYQFHGVELSNHAYNDKDHKGECPFCGKPKLMVNAETGQHRCLGCETTGNIYSFLASLHEGSLSNTTDADYVELGKARKLHPGALREAGFAKSSITGEWLRPTYNNEGNINNLYKVVEEITQAGRKMRLYQTPSCKAGLFGVDLLLAHPNAEVVRICEGPWDEVAMRHLISTNPRNVMAVLGVSGAGTFLPEWLDLLEGKQVELLYDNDHPQVWPSNHELAGQPKMRKAKAGSPATPIRAGWDGMQRVVELINKSPKRPSSLSLIHWNKFSTPISLNSLPAGERRRIFFPQGGVGILPYAEAGHHPDLPNGFDCRDLIAASPAVALATFPKLLVDTPISPPEKAAKAAANGKPAPSLAPIPRTLFSDLCNDYRQFYHFTQNMEDTLAVMLAVILSTEAPVDQLWLRVIGPPGSGKSTLAEAVSAAKEYVAARSMVTGFHSGFVEYDRVTGDRVEDSAPIKKLNNMTVVMKDADTLLTSPNRDRIMGEMRDFYDRVSRAEYRNKLSYEVEDLNVTFIICGTDALRSLNRTFLGERFLDIEIMDETASKKEYLSRASTNSYNQLLQYLSPPAATPDEPKQDASHQIKAATYGYIQHLRGTKHHAPAINFATLQQLEDLAQYLSYLRARKPKGDDLNYRPRAELATRLTSQFVKLAVYVAIVKGKAEVDDDTMRVVRKVVSDTAIGFQQEIVAALGKEPLSRKTLCMQLGLSDTYAARLLYEMLEFKIVQRKSQNNGSGQRGRDVHLWELTPQMRQLWLNAQGPPAPVVTQKHVSRPAKPTKRKATNARSIQKTKRKHRTGK